MWACYDQRSWGISSFEEQQCDYLSRLDYTGSVDVVYLQTNIIHYRYSALSLLSISITAHYRHNCDWLYAGPPTLSAMSGPRPDSIRPRLSRNAGPPPGPDVFPSSTSEIKTSQPVNSCPSVCLTGSASFTFCHEPPRQVTRLVCGLHLRSPSIESRLRRCFLKMKICVFWTQTSYSCCVNAWWVSKYVNYLQSWSIRLSLILCYRIQGTSMTHYMELYFFLFAHLIILSAAQLCNEFKNSIGL